MKTGDPETVSRTWQMAHLKYYFGHDRATLIMTDGKARFGRQRGERQSKRRYQQQARPLTRGTIGSHWVRKSLTSYSHDQS